jgi:hypothetical protein
MANYKGHLSAALIAAIIICIILAPFAFSFTTIGVWLFCASIGALFPDIDTKSKGQKLFYICLLPLFILFFLQEWLLANLILIFAAVVPLVVNHRGITHRLWFLFLVPATLALVLISYYPSLRHEIIFCLLFFCIGAFTHLWLDFGIKRMFIR